MDHTTYFPWLTIETTLPIFNEKFVVKFLFEKDLMKTEGIDFNVEYRMSNSL